MSIAQASSSPRAIVINLVKRLPQAIAAGRSSLVNLIAESHACRSGVRIVQPAAAVPPQPSGAGVEELPHQGSDVEEFEDSNSSSDGRAESNFEPTDESDDNGQGGAGMDGARARELRGATWGLFNIGMVYRMGCFEGYRATCGRHQNHDEEGQ